MQTEHTKILTALAREVLKPIGLRQRGRSRTWIADHGWWLAVVEFQPSAWSRGSYLNVGAMWLTYPMDHIVFHDGHREHAFEPFESSNQFRVVAEGLATLAAEKVESLRTRLATIAGAYQRQEAILADQETRQLWNLYYTASFATLAGEASRAKALAKEIAKRDVEYEWQQEVKRVSAATLLSATPVEAIKAHTVQARSLLKLVHPEATGLDAAA
jgi:hypothetical protein